MPSYAIRVEIVESHRLVVDAESAEKAKAMVTEAEHAQFYQFVEDHSVKLYVDHEVGEPYEIREVSDEQIP
jgi:hypothetical protein